MLPSKQACAKRDARRAARVFAAWWAELNGASVGARARRAATLRGGDETWVACSAGASAASAGQQEDREAAGVTVNDPFMTWRGDSTSVAGREVALIRDLPRILRS